MLQRLTVLLLFLELKEERAEALKASSTAEDKEGRPRHDIIEDLERYYCS